MYIPCGKLKNVILFPLFSLYLAWVIRPVIVSYFLMRLESIKFVIVIVAGPEEAS